MKKFLKSIYQYLKIFFLLIFTLIGILFCLTNISIGFDIILSNYVPNFDYHKLSLLFILGGSICLLSFLYIFIVILNKIKKLSK